MSMNIVQTMFALNLASNAACGQTNTPDVIQSLLTTYIKGGTYPQNYGYYSSPNNWTQTTPGFFSQLNSSLAGGDWEPVWGPVVYTDTSGNSTGTATNSAFVAVNPSQKAYVVSIAGTNFTSIEDWLDEDININPNSRVAWADFNPINLSVLTQQEANALFVAKIDAGSALGVTNLLTQLIDPNQEAGSQDLGHFLLNLPNSKDFISGASLYFTGHSLGGALTQVLALYLYAALVKNGWSNNILTMPTAGPTPGNEGFALLYDRIFPTTYSTGTSIVPNWNSDVISNADLVPACWNNITNVFTLKTDSAGNYQSFFGELGTDTFSLTIKWLDLTITSVPFGKGMGELALALGTFCGIFYAPVSQIPFTPTHGYYNRNKGNVTWTSFPLATDSNPIENLQDLGPYVLYAHTDQYSYYFFGANNPLPAFPSLPNS